MASDGRWPAETIRRRIRPWGMALALASVAAALALRLLMAPWLGERGVFLLFIVATVVSALYGGFWPGMLALGLGAGHRRLPVPGQPPKPVGTPEPRSLRSRGPRPRRGEPEVRGCSPAAGEGAPRKGPGGERAPRGGPDPRVRAAGDGGERVALRDDGRPGAGDGLDGGGGRARRLVQQALALLHRSHARGGAGERLAPGHPRGRSGAVPGHVPASGRAARALRDGVSPAARRRRCPVDRGPGCPPFRPRRLLPRLRRELPRHHGPARGRAEADLPGRGQRAARVLAGLREHARRDRPPGHPRVRGRRDRAAGHARGGPAGRGGARRHRAGERAQGSRNPLSHLELWSGRARAERERARPRGHRGVPRVPGPWTRPT